MAPAVPEVVADLAVLLLLALLGQLAVLLPLEVVALLEVVVLLELEAALAVEVPLLHRSLSVAMVGNLPSTGTPRYSPVPRSGRKAKRRR